MPPATARQAGQTPSLEGVSRRNIVVEDSLSDGSDSRILKATPEECACHGHPHCGRALTAMLFNVDSGEESGRGRSSPVIRAESKSGFVVCLNELSSKSCEV